MFIFGKAFEAAWSSANEVAKLSAAAVCTGAKAIGALPVLATKAENQIRDSYHSAANAVQGTVAEIKAGCSVTAVEWKSWMDAKVAAGASKLGMHVDAPAVERAGQADVAHTKAAQEQKLNALADEQQQKAAALRQADAQRLENARQLQHKINAAGDRTGQRMLQAVQSTKSAVDRLGRQADLLAIKALVRGGRTIMSNKLAPVTLPLELAKKAFNRIFPGKPSTCPRQYPAKALEEQLPKWQEVVNNAREKAEHMPHDRAAKLNAQADKLQKTIDDSKRAMLASAVYPPDPEKDGSDSPKATLGYERVSDEDLKKMNLDPSLFEPKHSGFRAALYKDDRHPAGYVLAFKGTTFDSSEDWENNFAQAVGLHPDYYQRAVRVAMATKQATGGNVTVTGHSLGGGLASAAAIKTGLKGSTYNAAGLSQDTVEYSKEEADRALTAYHVDGEPLTGLQTSLGGTVPLAAGSSVEIAPPPDAGLLDKHSMESVLYGMDQSGAKQAQDLQQLETAAAAGR